MIWWGFFSVSCLPRRSRQAKTGHLPSACRGEAARQRRSICSLPSVICLLSSVLYLT